MTRYGNPLASHTSPAQGHCQTLSIGWGTLASMIYGFDLRIGRTGHRHVHHVPHRPRPSHRRYRYECVRHSPPCHHPGVCSDRRALAPLARLICLEAMPRGTIIVGKQENTTRLDIRNSANVSMYNQIRFRSSLTFKLPAVAQLSLGNSTSKVMYKSPLSMGRLKWGIPSPMIRLTCPGLITLPAGCSTWMPRPSRCVNRTLENPQSASTRGILILHDKSAPLRSNRA